MVEAAGIGQRHHDPLAECRCIRLCRGIIRNGLATSGLRLYMRCVRVYASLCVVAAADVARQKTVCMYTVTEYNRNVIPLHLHPIVYPDHFFHTVLGLSRRRRHHHHNTVLLRTLPNFSPSPIVRACACIYLFLRYTFTHTYI